MVFGAQHRHRCDYFFKLSGPIILRCFLRQPIIANDYFTIITIIGQTINRNDASLKSIMATSRAPLHSRQVLHLTPLEVGWGP